MRARLLAVVAGCLIVLLSTPVAHGDPPRQNREAPGHLALQPLAQALEAQAPGDQALKGTLRGPNGKPVEGATITVRAGEDEIGTATTTADGTWEVGLPEPGTYTVALDTADLTAKKLQPRTKGGETLEDVVVRSGQQRTVIFPLIPASAKQQAPTTPISTTDDDTATTTASSGGTGFWKRFLQLFVEGIKFGAIIAITAVGLSLVFGTTRLINFAHGELVTIGALTAFWLSTDPGHLPLVLAAIGAVLVGAACGGAMERGLWRPMRRRGAGLIQMFIISIGVSLLLRHLILVIAGSRRSQYRQYSLQDEWELGPVSVTPRDATVTLLSVLVLLGVGFMLQRTRIGKAMRAVADNRDLAESSGIDVDRVVLIVWLMGGGLAALGGVFYGVTQAIYWDMGFNLLLLMFAGVILGGLGSAFGAVVGSFVVGMVAQLSTLWFPVELQNAWALLVLILVLVVRPQGILGRAERAG